MKKQHIVGITGVALVLVFVIGVYAYKSQQDKEVVIPAKDNESLLVREYSQTLGPDDARVHIVEFLDPGCETCRLFHPFVKSLIARHEGKVKLSIRYMPLHQGADMMVKILEAARRQEKYWEVLQVMFDSQAQWASHHHPEPDKIWQFLPAAGLDLETLRNDIEDPAIAEILQQDIADALSLNVRRTPSFFVNGKPLLDFGYHQLAALVDAAVAASY